MLYRFVGAVADLGDSRTLTRFGQSIELKDSEVADLVRQKVPLITDAAFSEIGFTALELQEFSVPDTPVPSTSTFHMKRHKAWLAAHDLREEFTKGA
jgi:hypothetical protein